MRLSPITVSLLTILLTATSAFAADGKAAPSRTPPKAEAPAKVEASPKAEAPAKTQTPAQPKPPAKTKAAPAKALPDDLTPSPIRHVVVCPPSRIAPCVMRKPVAAPYRILTNGVDVADDGANWIVDFGKGPKATIFLLQVLETGGSLHEIEVKFQAKAGMQKTPSLPE